MPYVQRRFLIFPQFPFDKDYFTLWWWRFELFILRVILCFSIYIMLFIIKFNYFHFKKYKHNCLIFLFHCMLTIVWIYEHISLHSRNYENLYNSSFSPSIYLPSEQYLTNNRNFSIIFLNLKLHYLTLLQPESHVINVYDIWNSISSGLNDQIYSFIIFKDSKI